MHQLFARKGVADLVSESLPGEQGTGLKRALGKWHLTALGVGAVIGAGIFSSTGTAIVGEVSSTGDVIRAGAGPAIVFSFMLVAVACAFAALCYAEFAAMVPVSGSAYTYAYASLGEFVAWIIGWDLIIEYAVGNVAVAISWAGYFRELLDQLGLHLPAWISIDYRTAHQAATAVAGGATDATNVYLASALTTAPHIAGFPIIFNLPAVVIVGLITVLLVWGIKESANSNAILVLLKIGIVLFFSAVGLLFIKPSNYTSFGGFAPHGFAGISAGAAIIFFAYIGFDAVSTAAEETKDPARDMPFGILMSLVICTIIYVVVALVMTGIAPWTQLGTAEPMLTALNLAHGSPQLLAISHFIVAVGAVLAMTTVLLVFQLGQPRIFFSMARDGLLPPWAAKIHPKFRTPHITTIMTGVFVAFFAAFANIDEVVNLTNIGTLFAFILVSAGILILRKTDKDRPRPFRTPLVPWVPLASIVTCGFLMFQLPWVTWVRFIVWLAIGLVLYFSYGFRHSRLRAAGR